MPRTAAPGRTRRRADRVVPDQHGAWGFLALPIALGSAAAEGWSWAVVPIGLTWVALYPLSWALSGRLTAASRPERFDRALRLWAALAVPLVVAAVLLRPWLVWVAAAYLVPFGVNLAFARARRERDLANDLVLVAECSAATAVVAAVASGQRGWSAPVGAMTTAPVGLAVLLCAVTLIGSTLHVKSLIRERHDPRYRRAAQVFAVAAVPAVALAAGAAGLSAWTAVPFLLLALRTAPSRLRTWRPARVGMVELVGFVAVAVTAFVALR